MIPRLFACFLLVFSTTLASSHQTLKNKPEAPVKVSVCQLNSDPTAYDHKLVDVTAFAAQSGRENFDWYDPSCPAKRDVQLKYGGEPVEEIPTRFVDTAVSNRFEKQLYPRDGSGNRVVHATIVGRFFAGKQERYQNGYVRQGRNILVIERIVSVDPHRSKTFDYLVHLDEPELEREGCGFDELTEDATTADLIKAQEKADRGNDAWVFTDPKRVASSSLANLLSKDETSIKLTLTHRAQGRLVYEWQPQKDGDNYLVVVSRPYLLSFYAKNPNRVAWVLRAAYQAGCDNNKRTRRIN